MAPPPPIRSRGLTANRTSVVPSSFSSPMRLRRGFRPPSRVASLALLATVTCRGDADR